MNQITVTQFPFEMEQFGRPILYIKSVLPAISRALRISMAVLFSFLLRTDTKLSDGQGEAVFLASWQADSE